MDPGGIIILILAILFVLGVLSHYYGFAINPFGGYLEHKRSEEKRAEELQSAQRRAQLAMLESAQVYELRENLNRIELELQELRQKYPQLAALELSDLEEGVVKLKELLAQANSLSARTLELGDPGLTKLSLQEYNLMEKRYQEVARMASIASGKFDILQYRLARLKQNN